MLNYFKTSDFIILIFPFLSEAQVNLALEQMFCFLHVQDTVMEPCKYGCKWTDSSCTTRTHNKMSCLQLGAQIHGKSVECIQVHTYVLIL